MGNIAFQCHSCKVYIAIPWVGEPSKPMRFKWKDKRKMTQVHVCETCWERARSLKVPEVTKSK